MTNFQQQPFTLGPYNTLLFNHVAHLLVEEDNPEIRLQLKFVRQKDKANEYYKNYLLEATLPIFPTSLKRSHLKSTIIFRFCIQTES